MEGRTLVATVIAVALVVMVGGTALIYGSGPPPAPPRPVPPPPSEVPLTAEVKFSPTIYRAQIETDSKAYDLPPMPVAQIAQPNPYFEEWSGRYKLKLGGSLDTAHLKISTQILKLQAGRAEGQVVTIDHLVLRIENTTPLFLAYRVVTDLSNKNKCANKGTIAHNAIVIEPMQVITRTECMYRGSETIEVDRVEVIELPPLSAYYVSRLPPALVLYEPRTSAGHSPSKGTMCQQTFSWRDIRDGADRKELGWRDVIDFYARHNCDEFAFFKSYRYRTAADEPIPVRPPEGR